MTARRKTAKHGNRGKQDLPLRTDAAARVRGGSVPVGSVGTSTVISTTGSSGPKPSPTTEGVKTTPTIR